MLLHSLPLVCKQSSHIYCDLEHNGRNFLAVGFSLEKHGVMLYKLLMNVFGAVVQVTNA